jgi:6-phosphogluconolactonase
VVVRFRDAAAAARAGAEAVAEAAFKALRERGGFRVVLAGGNTPRATYELLSNEMRDAVEWSRATVYFGDERCVPPDHPYSNYRMVREALLDPLGLRGAAVRRIAGELPPESAAMDYEAELRHLRSEGEPMFDLVLLGMGPDGHTASLFPGHPALDEVSHLALHVTVSAEPADRVTLTPPALGSTRQIVFLVTGTEKSIALARVFADEDLPAARIAALAPSRFLVDEAAASKLPA